MLKGKYCQITLDERPVSYILKKSKRARFLRMEIRPEEGLVVTVPHHCSGRDVRHFLEHKSSWITMKLAEFGPDISNSPQLSHGENVPYLGSKLKIEVRDIFGQPAKISLIGNSLVVLISGDDHLESVIEGWLRQQARLILGNIIEAQSSRMRVTYNRFYLKSQRTIWGSCSRKQNLNFNWRLVMVPQPVISYVVIHELAHLNEMSHSNRFWQIVADHCPDWRIHRQWLKDHGNELNRILRPRRNNKR